MVGFMKGLGCGGGGSGPGAGWVNTFNPTVTNTLYAAVNEQWPSFSGVDSRWFPQDKGTGPYPAFFATWPAASFDWGTGKWRFAESFLMNATDYQRADINLWMTFAEENKTLFNIDTLSIRWAQSFTTRAYPEGPNFNRPLNATSYGSAIINSLFSVDCRPGWIFETSGRTDETKFYLTYSVGNLVAVKAVSTANPAVKSIEVNYNFVSLTAFSSDIWKLTFNLIVNVDGVEEINQNGTAYVKGTGTQSGVISACGRLELGHTIFADGYIYQENTQRMIPLPESFFLSYNDYVTVDAVWR